MWPNGGHLTLLRSSASIHIGRQETHVRRSPLSLFFLGTLLALACKPGDETSGSSGSGTWASTGNAETSETETLTATETEPSSTTGPDPSTTDATFGSDSEEDDTESPESDTSETTDGGPMCPNGIVEEGEQCDDGILADNGPCVSGCLHNVCGDGKLWLGVETCDAGPQNGAYAGSCGADCTTESIPKCGDGILQDEYEACEHNEINQDGVACDTEQCTWGDFRYVFVTSLSFTGDLATELVNEGVTGVARADTICQVLAAGDLPGTYYAWISDNNNLPTSNAAARIGGAQDSPTATYVMPNGGSPVAANWNEFVTSGPQVPITRDESGEEVEELPTHVWTNTSTAGLSLGHPSCENW
ncbi:MAG: hypothetical protein ACPG4T_23410, partial [Nannocystaceae bacterium]